MTIHADPKRDEHMMNAQDFAEQIIEEGKKRNVSPAELFVSVAVVLSGRNATLAGKILEALMSSVRQRPLNLVDANGKPVMRVVN